MVDLPKLPALSRRGWLIGGAAAVAGAGGLGGLWFALSSPKDLVVALLKRALPGVDLEPASLGQCAQDVIADVDGTMQDGSMEQLVSTLKLKGVTAASHVLGADGVAGLGPFAERLEEITRLGVTRLLVNSNFFYLADPTAGQVVYRSPDVNQPCGNPLANLSPPADA